MIRKHGRPSMHAGFSLVELMVGMVIGLLTVIVIAQVIVIFDSQKRTVSSGADAQENGLISLNAMATDTRMSGYGLITSGMMGCTSINTYYNGVTTLGTLIMPVMITDGGTGSDTITTLYSDSGNGGIPARIVNAMPNSSAVLTVNTSNGMNVNDLVLVSTPGSGLPCSRLQITAVQTQANGVNVIHNSGLSLYNPPGGQNIFPAAGYGTTPTSYVFDLGAMVNNRYQILCNTLTITDLNTQTGVPGCTDQNTFTNATPLASNIVNIQAQYGVAPAGNQSVSCWTDAVATPATACGATGGWAAPAAADIPRIKAIRVAIVARSALMEKPTTGTTCDASAAAPTSWPGGPAVNLSADPNWACYRYKVYQTIIPLRNVIWANM